MAARLKKCTSCGEWKPATPRHFYKTTSRGRSINSFGELYLRSQCIPCKLAQNEEYRLRSEAEKERSAKMQRARRRAYRRLAKLNEEGFKILYSQELAREGINLEHYNGPIHRRSDEADG